MEITLYDGMGTPVAYYDTENTIWLWDGQAVAYFDGQMIYSWRGRHIGWFIGDIMYDIEGYKVGFTASTCPKMLRMERMKKMQRMQKMKGMQRMARAQRVLKSSTSNTLLSDFLEKADA